MTTSTIVELPTLPTQVSHPWKAAVRTFIQALLSGLVVAVAAWPILQDFLVQIGLDGSGFFAWTTSAGVVLAALAAGVSRLMAIPAVEQFLQKLGVGAVPKGETDEYVITTDVRSAVEEFASTETRPTSEVILDEYGHDLDALEKAVASARARLHTGTEI